MSKLVEQLKRHEGIRTHAYQCTANMTTVGVGRNIDEDGGLGLSIDEIEFLLENDIRRCKQELIALPWFPEIDSVRQDALINMCFNLGGTRLSKFKNMLAACRKHDWNEMARQMEDSRWFGQVGRRSKELQDLVLQQNDSVY
jgi:lysozyme